MENLISAYRQFIAMFSGYPKSLILLCIFSVVGVTQASTDLAAERIRYSGPAESEDGLPMTALILRCEKAVKGILNDQQASRYISITAAAAPAFADTGAVAVSLSPSAGDTELKVEILRGLIGRRILEIQRRRTPLDPAVIPGWLIAGLFHRVSPEGETPDSRRTFAAIRSFLDNDEVPRVCGLIDLPIPSEFENLYHLYGEFCACLIILFKHQNSDFFPQYFEALDNSSSIADSVFARLPGLETETEIQSWYEQQLRNAVYNSAMPCSYLFARKWRRKAEAAVVSLALERNVAGMEGIAIDDLAEFIGEESERDRIIRLLQLHFLMLQQKSPTLLRPAYNLYAKGFRLLESGNRSGYRSAIKKARKKFDQITDEGTRISDYLDIIDASFAPSTINVAQRSGLTGNGNDSLSAVATGIHEYLDSIERRMMSGGECRPD